MAKFGGTHYVKFKDELPWPEWAQEERERQASKAPAKYIRPSISLPETLVAKLDRVAAVQGLERSQVVEMALDFFFASWRPRGK